MTKECVFKIEYKGRLYRVVKHPYDYHGDVFKFVVEYKRRVLGKIISTSERSAIEFAMWCAFGVDIDLEGSKLL